MKIEMRALDSLKEYGKNPRVIPPAAIEAVAKSLKAFGWRQPIVVDAEGVIIVGHARAKAAWSLGMTEVPVHVANLTPAQAKAYRIADNQTATLAAFDDDLLAAELADLKALDFDLDSLGFDADELAEKMAGPVPVDLSPSHHDDVDHIRCPKCGFEFAL